MLQVSLPGGLSGASALTGDHSAAVTTNNQRTRPTPYDVDLQFQWDSSLDRRFRVQRESTTNLPGTRDSLKWNEGLFLKPENIPVSDEAGLVIVESHDRTGVGGISLPDEGLGVHRDGKMKDEHRNFAMPGWPIGSM